MSLCKDENEPLKYGDVFDVHGELASKPIVPRDAAAIQAAENIILGREAPEDSIAAVMQSAAAANEMCGAISHDDATNIAKEPVTIIDTTAAGIRVITETIGDQVLGQYTQPTVVQQTGPAAVGADPITIGEALEAAARYSWDKPVEQSDAAAIKAAEIRVSGTNQMCGIGAAAQSAANRNQWADCDENKIKLGEIVEDARCKLGRGDKPATMEDAEGVIAAEIRSNPQMTIHPHGVAESVAKAARFNAK